MKNSEFAIFKKRIMSHIERESTIDNTRLDMTMQTSTINFSKDYIYIILTYLLERVKIL